MSGSEPAVRASAVRDTLAFLDKFHPGSQARVMALVPEASRTVIEETSRLSWISIAHDHWTIDGMIEVFGRDRAIRCWADSVTNLVEQPLLRTFVSGMLALDGNDPARVIALIPKGWSMVYRDMCTPSFSLDVQGRPVIAFDDIDPLVRIHDNYIASWHGACLGMARLARVSARVDLWVADDRSRAEATFVFGNSMRPS